MATVFGDPNEFAVCALIVPEWSTDRFSNGLLFYMVKGDLIGKGVKHATLNTALPLIFERKDVAAQVCDPALAELPLREVFIELYARTWAVGGREQDASYNVATYSQTDKDEMVFLLKTPLGYDRLIWGLGRDFDIEKNDLNLISDINECHFPEGLVLKTIQLAASYKW